MPNPFALAVRDMEARPVPMRRQAVYGGAQGGRLYEDWYAPISSADYEIRVSMRTLRARARQLVRDNGYAWGFVDGLANNVIGPLGIRLESRIKTAIDELHQPTNTATEEGWADWGMPENASADGQDDWTSLQRMHIQTQATDGEALWRKLSYYDNDHGYALEPIDVDRLDEFYNRLPAPGINEIRMGVEITPKGKPVAYHIWDRHPTDGGIRRRERVPADEIIHDFVRFRPGQTRGVTWFAPVLTTFKMHDGYTDAELVAARTAAAKMGFIVTKANPDGMGPGVDLETTDNDKPREFDAAAGVIDELEPGQEFQGWDPSHPTTAFKEFSDAILRGISRGVGMAYTTFTGNLAGVNFSSIRAGLLEERDRYRMLQVRTAIRFCRPVYFGWVPMARLTGKLRADGRVAADYRQVVWKGRGWTWVDPLKDVQADILAIQHGLESRTDILDEQGRDIRIVFEHLKEETDMADQMGVDINPVAPPQPNKPLGQPSKTDTEEGPHQDNNEDSTHESDEQAVLPRFRSLVAMR